MPPTKEELQLAALQEALDDAKAALVTAQRRERAIRKRQPTDHKRLSDAARTSEEAQQLVDKATKLVAGAQKLVNGTGNKDRARKPHARYGRGRR